MKKLLPASAAIGVALFALFVYVRPNDFLSRIELLMFFGVAAIAPLALANLKLHQNEPLYAAAANLQPVAALGVGISLFTHTGLLQGGLALAWLAFTVLVALLGLQRWLPHGRIPLNEFCLIAGMIYAPISGIWFAAYAVWGSFLGFDTAITLLTGVHFCFISLGGLVIAGLLGRVTQNRWYRYTAWGAIISPALVAVGITLTQVAGRVTLVEVASVVLLAASFLLLAAVTVVTVPRHISHTLGKWLTVASSMSLLITMGFALAYSVGRYTGWWGVDIPRMVRWHGWFNAIGFVFLGLVGWSVVQPSPRSPLGEKMGRGTSTPQVEVIAKS